MSKKDTVNIAQALRCALLDPDTDRATVIRVINRIDFVLKQRYPRFDSQKFKEAIYDCTLSPNVKE